MAAEFPEEETQTVTIIEKKDPYKDYLLRRTNWGWVIGFEQQNFLPSTYSSPIDGSEYSEVYGKKSALGTGAKLLLKFNGSFGSAMVGPDFSTGKTSSSFSGDARTLNYTQIGARLQINLDSLFSEPYVVPYGAYRFSQFSFNESSTNTPGDYKTTASLVTGQTLGVLLQLNWIDPDTAHLGYWNYSLENTYVDIFITRWDKPASTTDPDASSDFALGFGLTLEF